MPGMPRPNKKAQKLAYAVIGVPANIASKKTSEQKKIDQRLNFEESYRSR